MSKPKLSPTWHFFRDFDAKVKALSTTNVIRVDFKKKVRL